MTYHCAVSWYSVRIARKSAAIFDSNSIEVSDIRQFQKEKRKHLTKCSLVGAHGGSFQDLEICEVKLLREYDVDQLGPALDFFRIITKQRSNFVRSTAVCLPIFRRDLSLQVLNPIHVISNVTAL